VDDAILLNKDKFRHDGLLVHDLAGGGDSEQVHGLYLLGLLRGGHTLGGKAERETKTAC
jgi:hypothetical protein